MTEASRKCERSSAGEHRLHTAGVAGSIPAARTISKKSDSQKSVINS